MPHLSSVSNRIRRRPVSSFQGGDSIGGGAFVPISYLDADGTLAANSDTRVATQKAVKTYADFFVVADEITDATCFPAFFTGATGRLGPKTAATRWTFNSNTGTMVLKGSTGKLQVKNETGGSTLEILDLSDVPVITLSNQSQGLVDAAIYRIKTGGGVFTQASAGNTFRLCAFDVDGGTYTTFMTFTANNTPTCVFTSPVDIGTPSGGNLASCVGLPVATGIAGLGTDVATALAINVGSPGAFAIQGLVGTKVYYVSDTNGGPTDRKLTFTNGVLTSET